MSQITDLNARIRGNQVKSVNNIHQDEHEDQADARRVTLIDFFGNPINTSNRLPVDAIINVTDGDPVDTPLQFRVPVPIADTEYSQALPSRTKRFEIHTESRRGTIKLSYVAGGTTSNYRTIKPGNTYPEKDIDVTGMILYFRINKAGETVEILTWT